MEGGVVSKHRPSICHCTGGLESVNLTLFQNPEIPPWGATPPTLFLQRLPTATSELHSIEKENIQRRLYGRLKKSEFHVLIDGFCKAGAQICSVLDPSSSAIFPRLFSP
jgi:hypothetical protein